MVSYLAYIEHKYVCMYIHKVIWSEHDVHWVMGQPMVMVCMVILSLSRCTYYLPLSSSYLPR